MLTVRSMMILVMGSLSGLILTGLLAVSKIDITPTVLFSLMMFFVAGAVCGLYQLNKKLRAQKRRIHNLQIRNDKIIASANKFIVDRVVELRRPLQGMVGIHDLYATSSSPLEAKDYLDIADFCSRFLIRQLERIQLFSEMEGSGLHSENAPFSLKKCVDDAVSLACEQANSKDVAIIEEWSPSISEHMDGNESFIRKTLVELLDNAIRYGGQGRIYLRIMPDADNKSQIRFVVSDSGPGISERQLQKFNSEPKRKETAPWKAAKDGMGIYLIKRMVREMRGTLHVESRKGMGTTISFLLPSESLRAVNSLPQRPEASLELSRVLVVDDEPISRQIITSILKKLGLSADTAENGRDAIHKCQQGSYDLIFMDLSMPVLDGFEASRVILHDLNLNKTPKIVIVSSHCKQEDRDKCQSIGVSNFLSKPARLDHIRECLKKLGHLGGKESSFVNHPELDSASDSLTTIRSKESSNLQGPREPGYHINFNQLYNSLDENMTLCHDILNRVSVDLDANLEHLARAVAQNDRKEIYQILHKAQGELSMILCSTGVAAVEKMMDAVRVEGAETLQTAFQELSEVFEGIISEIQSMKKAETMAV